MAWGVEVQVLFVRDDAQDIVEALRWVVDRHDYVFTTGGDGADSRRCHCRGRVEADRPMVHSPSLESLLEKLYNVPPGPERTRLCLIPEGSELIYPENARVSPFSCGQRVPLSGCALHRAQKVHGHRRAVSF